MVEDPIPWIVSDLSPGMYRIHGFDRSTGLCIESDFRFLIPSGLQIGTPTPSSTAISPLNTRTPNPTSTVTNTPDGTQPTSTPTLDFYIAPTGPDGLLNAPDLLMWLNMISEDLEEAGLLFDFTQNWNSINE